MSRTPTSASFVSGNSDCHFLSFNEIRHDAGMITLENAHFRLQLDKAHAAVRSLVVKSMNCELIGEPRLLANFRLCLPLEDYQCNYIDGMEQLPKSVSQSTDGV